MELVDVVDSKSTGSDTVPVRARPPAPRRSKLCIACSDFFQKSERTHAAAPPFQPRPACAGLASDDEHGSDIDCSTAPKQYNPNLVFPVGDGFGFIVFFSKITESTTPKGSVFLIKRNRFIKKRYESSSLWKNRGDQHAVIFDPGKDIAVHLAHKLAADVQAKAAAAAVFHIGTPPEAVENMRQLCIG